MERGEEGNFLQSLGAPISTGQNVDAGKQLQSQRIINTSSQSRKGTKLQLGKVKVKAGASRKRPLKTASPQKKRISGVAAVRPKRLKALQAPPGASKSRAPQSKAIKEGNLKRQRASEDLCDKVSKRLAESNDPAVNTPGFSTELQAHFNRLPSRYALDLNMEHAEDVLLHMKLLESAKDPAARPAVVVRTLVPADGFNVASSGSLRESLPGESYNTATHLCARQPSIPPPPAFGCPDHEGLAQKAADAEDNGSADQPSSTSFGAPHALMHEVIISTVDTPKLFSQVSSVLATIGLNIQEAHSFSTGDGYSLEVFKVVGCSSENLKDLQLRLKKRLAEMEDATAPQDSAAKTLKLEGLHENLQRDFPQKADNLRADSREVVGMVRQILGEELYILLKGSGSSLAQCLLFEEDETGCVTSLEVVPRAGQSEESTSSTFVCLYGEVSAVEAEAAKRQLQDKTGVLVTKNKAGTFEVKAIGRARASWGCGWQGVCMDCGNTISVQVRDVWPSAPRDGLLLLTVDDLARL